MSIEILRIHSKVPYEIGFEHGMRFKPVIQELYQKTMEPFLKEVQKTDPKRDIYKLGKKMVEAMNPAIFEELKGLSNGAKVPLKMVIKVNTFLTVFPEISACSTMYADFATDRDHPKSFPVENLTFEHYKCKGMNETLLTNRNIMDVMIKAERDTIQCVIFDPLHQRFYLSSDPRGEKAPEGPFFEFTKEQLFEGDMTPPRRVSREEFDLPGKCLVGRNLDWGIPELGMHSIVLISDSLARISFPGFIGCLTGMRSDGFNLSMLMQGHTRLDGFENSLLLYHILATTPSGKMVDALRSLPVGATFNVMMSGPSEAAAFCYLSDGSVKEIRPQELKVKEFRALFEEHANAIFKAVYDLAPQPRLGEGDLLWGEHHFDDNKEVLKRAIRKVLGAQETPFLIKSSSYERVYYSLHTSERILAPQDAEELISLINAESLNFPLILETLKKNRASGETILHLLWKMAGMPMGDPLWAEHHLESHFHLLPRAISKVYSGGAFDIYRKLKLMRDVGLSELTLNQLSHLAVIVNKLDSFSEELGIKLPRVQVMSYFLCYLDSMERGFPDEYERLMNWKIYDSFGQNDGTFKTLLTSWVEGIDTFSFFYVLMQTMGWKYGCHTTKINPDLPEEVPFYQGMLGGTLKLLLEKE
jgi:hypothetical protein